VLLPPQVPKARTSLRESETGRGTEVAAQGGVASAYTHAATTAAAAIKKEKKNNTNEKKTHDCSSDGSNKVHGDGDAR